MLTETGSGYYIGVRGEWAEGTQETPPPPLPIPNDSGKFGQKTVDPVRLWRVIKTLIRALSKHSENLITAITSESNLDYIGTFVI